MMMMMMMMRINTSLFIRWSLLGAELSKYCCVCSNLLIARFHEGLMMMMMMITSIHEDC